MATTAWRATDLSVSPPSFQMADTDRESFAFDAGEAIVDATAVLTRLDTLATVPTSVESVIVATPLATVTVSGLIRGLTYELAVTMERSDGRKWTKTLVLDVVA